MCSMKCQQLNKKHKLTDYPGKKNVHKGEGLHIFLTFLSGLPYSSILTHVQPVVYYEVLVLAI